MASALSAEMLRDGDEIGVVDDLRDDAEMTSDLLAVARLTPVIVPLLLDADLMVKQLKGRVKAVICDHRLRPAVRYTGADFVARCMSENLPAVLITTFANTSDSAAIQRFKASIPNVLRRGVSSTPDVIRNALENASLEVKGEFSPGRRPYRTIVRAVGLEDADQVYVEVFIVAWNPNEALRVPVDLITKTTGLSAEQIVGRRFLADVNIYAESADDVYMKNFEVLEEPPVGWMQP